MLSQSIRSSRGYLHRLTHVRACTTYQEVIAGRHHHVPEEPKTATTILLRDLPTSAVLDSVKKAVESTRPHRVALEPGCAIHVAREDEVNVALGNIVSNLNLQVFILLVCDGVIIALVPCETSIDAVSRTEQHLERCIGRSTQKHLRTIPTQSCTHCWRSFSSGICCSDMKL